MCDGPTNDFARTCGEIGFENPDVEPFRPVSTVQDSMALRGESFHGLTEVVDDVPSSWRRTCQVDARRGGVGECRDACSAVQRAHVRHGGVGIGMEFTRRSTAAFQRRIRDEFLVCQPLVCFTVTIGPEHGVLLRCGALWEDASIPFGIDVVPDQFACKRDFKQMSGGTFTDEMVPIGQGLNAADVGTVEFNVCLLYTSPSPRDDR